LQLPKPDKQLTFYIEKRKAVLSDDLPPAGVSLIVFPILKCLPEACNHPFLLYFPEYGEV